MKKVKNTIPVYDICSLNGHNHINNQIIAEPFAAYLKRHPNLQAPHGHTFYHMLLFTKGKGYYTIDFEKFEVRPGQIYFMSPGQVHSWNFTGATDGYIINFDEKFLQQMLANEQYMEQFSFLRSNAPDCVIQTDNKTFPAVRQIFECILSEVHMQQSFTQDMICSLLAALFITIQRSIPNATTTIRPLQGQLMLHNFRKLVNTYYHEKHLPKEYAEMLYITPNYLNALCNDLLGKPSGEVIRERILLEAKRLLVNAKLNISEIAFRTGFSDNSHFTKFFKKYTNITPEEFRRTSINS